MQNEIASTTNEQTTGMMNRLEILFYRDLRYLLPLLQSATLVDAMIYFRFSIVVAIGAADTNAFRTILYCQRTQ